MDGWMRGRVDGGVVEVWWVEERWERGSYIVGWRGGRGRMDGGVVEVGWMEER